MKTATNKQLNTLEMKTIIQNQILRLAKLYISRPVNLENIEWHNRIAFLQCDLIVKKKKFKSIKDMDATSERKKLAK